MRGFPCMSWSCAVATAGALGHHSPPQLLVSLPDRQHEIYIYGERDALEKETWPAFQAPPTRSAAPWPTPGFGWSTDVDPVAPSSGAHAQNVTVLVRHARPQPLVRVAPGSNRTHPHAHSCTSINAMMPFRVMPCGGRFQVSRQSI